MFQKFLKFKTISATFLLSILFVAGGWFWMYFALRKVSQPLIIHFNNLVGIDRVGGLTDLSAVGILAVVGILINFFIALELEERDWFLGKLLAAATLFFSALIFLGLAAIINVN